MPSTLIISCRKCGKIYPITLLDCYKDILNEIVKLHGKCSDGFKIQIRFGERRYEIRPTTSKIYDIYGDKPLIGAEIGVFHGFNALSILESLNIKKLYLIDPYANYEAHDMEKTFIETQQLLSPHKNKIQFVRKSSEDVVNEIPDELDFVYIDGNHDYKHVKQDMELYYPKVRKGGILGGHDLGVHEPGVLQAVGEFITEHGIDYKDRRCKSFLEDWYIIK